MRDEIINRINNQADRFIAISLFIGEHPELGHQEFLAFEKLTGELRAQGFEVEAPVLGLETAFIGTYRAAKPGPTVAFLCEYDALPELGHACGHHLICSMSMLAAVGLKAVIERVGGEIRVYGTPAEETKGAKVPMADAGLFDDVDIALMGHPYYRHEKSGSSLAMDALRFEYFGKPAHAAASPHEGINALDAMLLLFGGINALRQQLASHVRIHGVIKEGGKAPNIIPDYTSADFYIRSANRPHTDEVVQKVLRVAEGAALATGCTLRTSNYEYAYDELITNEPLSELFSANLLALGVEEGQIYSGKDNGSLDLGNVSRRCPSIHPFVQIIDERHLLHTKEFRDQAMSARAMQGMVLAAQALALTAFDAVSDPEALARIRERFLQSTAD
ncbi:M20 family metallopeptidase [Paenibacillus koleovorans]|uniref:M20 family metallopeptidase n=1 Tax=Paenibacillus koleovorans TaxID=121608 RepID=UPI000FDC60DC|nr:M20 family metallopeptidase [Paenibacillus koleovorans]